MGTDPGFWISGPTRPEYLCAKMTKVWGKRVIQVIIHSIYSRQEGANREKIER